MFKLVMGVEVFDVVFGLLTVQMLLLFLLRRYSNFRFVGRTCACASIP